MLYIHPVPVHEYQLQHNDPHTKTQRRICDALVDVPTAYMRMGDIYDLFDAFVSRASLLLRFNDMSTTYIKHEGERNWYEQGARSKYPLTLGEFCEMFCMNYSFVIDWFPRRRGEHVRP